MFPTLPPTPLYLMVHLRRGSHLCTLHAPKLERIRERAPLFSEICERLVAPLWSSVCLSTFAMQPRGLLIDCMVSPASFPDCFSTLLSTCPICILTYYFPDSSLNFANINAEPDQRVHLPKPPTNAIPTRFLPGQSKNSSRVTTKFPIDDETSVWVAVQWPYSPDTPSLNAKICRGRG